MNQAIAGSVAALCFVGALTSETLAGEDPHAMHGAPPAAGAAADPHAAHTGATAAQPEVDHSAHMAPGADPHAAHMAAGADPHAGHGAAGHMHAGALGSYAMTRDASGTSWQPESTPTPAIMGQLGEWSTMLHGFATLVFDHQGGPRGDDMTFSESMLMGMAQRHFSASTLTLKAMVSLDPTMGKQGYPLLLQTGETADGVTPLIDRQHPHDLFMELSATYSTQVGAGQSVFLYVGYPGEPALGPPAFMHRFSGMDSPEAPLSHHWLDSTHITYGVVTAGFVWDTWKLEASAFNGREPDEHRWDFDPPRLDSGSVRLSWNPSANWAVQASWGYIHVPESLEPGIDQRRTTASVSYNHPFEGGNWQTILAWGQNDKSPGDAPGAWLLESAVELGRHTVFARAEDVDKDELFQSGPLAGESFSVGKFSLGYVYDIPVAEHLKLGFGALGSLYALPSALQPTYGSSPKSYMLFTRLALR